MRFKREPPNTRYGVGKRHHLKILAPLDAVTTVPTISCKAESSRLASTQTPVFPQSRIDRPITRVRDSSGNCFQFKFASVEARLKNANEVKNRWAAVSEMKRRVHRWSQGWFKCGWSQEGRSRSRSRSRLFVRLSKAKTAVDGGTYTRCCFTLTQTLAVRLFVHRVPGTHSLRRRC